MNSLSKFEIKGYRGSYSECGHRVRDREEEIRGNCPVPNCPNPKGHFYLNKKTGKWICFRCGTAGNYAYYLSLKKNIPLYKAFQEIEQYEQEKDVSLEDLKEKLYKLSENKEILQYETYTKIYPPIESKDISIDNYPQYLINRNIPVWLSERVHVKYCNSGFHHNRIIFPFKCNNNISYVSYATLPSQNPKTLNPLGSENEKLLYNYNFISHSTKDLIVVEGIFDCLRLILYGYNSVALLGSYLNKQKAILLSNIKCNNIYFMLDGDIPLYNGVKTYYKVLKNINLIVGKKIFFAEIPDKNKDPDSLTEDEVKTVISNSRIPNNFSNLTSKLYKLKGQYE